MFDYDYFCQDEPETTSCEFYVCEMTDDFDGPCKRVCQYGGCREDES